MSIQYANEVAGQVGLEIFSPISITFNFTVLLLGTYVLLDDGKAIVVRLFYLLRACCQLPTN